MNLNTIMSIYKKPPEFIATLNKEQSQVRRALQESRRIKILGIVKLGDGLGVPEISKGLKMSKSTIRIDLSAMVQEGRLLFTRTLVQRNLKRWEKVYYAK